MLRHPPPPAAGDPGAGPGVWGDGPSQVLWPPGTVATARLCSPLLPASFPSHFVLTFSLFSYRMSTILSSQSVTSFIGGLVNLVEGQRPGTTARCRPSPNVEGPLPPLAHCWFMLCHVWLDGSLLFLFLHVLCSVKG